MSAAKVTCLRLEDGSVRVEHDGKEIEDVVAFSVSAAEAGAVATIVFKVGTVEVQDKLHRIFGGVEIEQGLAQDGSNLIQ